MTVLKAACKGLCYCILFVPLLLPFMANAQQFDQSIIGIQGDFEESPFMSLSWTIGDLAILTAEADGKILTQGFQQSNLNIRKIATPYLTTLDAHVFPNPTRGELTINVSHDTTYKLALFDGLGRLMKEYAPEDALKHLDMSDYEEGIYYLRIQDNNSPAHSLFEIIKL